MGLVVTISQHNLLIPGTKWSTERKSSHGYTAILLSFPVLSFIYLGSKASPKPSRLAQPSEEDVSLTLESSLGTPNQKSRNVQIKAEAWGPGCTAGSIPGLTSTVGLISSSSSLLSDLRGGEQGFIQKRCPLSAGRSRLALKPTRHSASAALWRSDGVKRNILAVRYARR